MTRIPPFTVYRLRDFQGVGRGPVRYHRPSLVIGMDDIAACSVAPYMEAAEVDDTLLIELDETTGRPLGRVPIGAICTRCFVVSVEQNVSLTDDTITLERVTPE